MGSSLLAFVTLWKVCGLVLPFLSFLLNWLLVLGLSWPLGCLFAKKVIFPKIPQMNTSDKAVIVTGCDTGFGHATALRLNRDGFYVLACCLNSESEGAKKLLRNAYKKDKMKVVQVDVTRDSDILQLKSIVDNLLTKENASGITELYALVNNAGILLNSGIEWGANGPSCEDFEKMFDVNVYGVVRMTRIFLPLLRKSKGRVVNVTSIAARLSAHGFTAYCASKAAAAKFTEGLYMEMAPFGVKCISIEPYQIKTEILNVENMTKAITKAWKDSSEEIRSSYGLDAYKDVVRYVRFISTDESFINPRIEDASDAIADAILSPEPDPVVEVMQLKHYIPHIIISSLPWEVAHHVRLLMQSLVLKKAPALRD